MSIFFSFSQLAELADGYLRNEKRRVGRWNWFTGAKKCKSDPEADVSTLEAPDVTFYTWQE